MFAADIVIDHMSQTVFVYLKVWYTLILTINLLNFWAPIVPSVTNTLSDIVNSRLIQDFVLQMAANGGICMISHAKFAANNLQTAYKDYLYILATHFPSIPATQPHYSFSLLSFSSSAYFLFLKPYTLLFHFCIYIL